MKVKSGCPCPALRKTALEFAEHTSVHGVSYVAEKKVALSLKFSPLTVTKVPLLGKLLWASVCALSMSLAIKVSVDAFNQWQRRPVITTLKNIAKPVDEIDFPAVTICGSGLYMENIEKTLEKKFNSWRLRNKKSWDSDDLKDLLAEFMEEKFQIKEKGLTIMDILNTMVSPNNVDNVLLSNIVRENALACEAQAANSGRKKRESSSTLLSGNYNFQLILAFDLCL